jgi:hypothetical protein
VVGPLLETAPRENFVRNPSGMLFLRFGFPTDDQVRDDLEGGGAGVRFRGPSSGRVRPFLRVKLPRE